MPGETERPSQPQVLPSHLPPRTGNLARDSLEVRLSSLVLGTSHPKQLVFRALNTLVMCPVLEMRS